MYGWMDEHGRGRHGKTWPAIAFNALDEWMNEWINDEWMHEWMDG